MLCCEFEDRFHSVLDDRGNPDEDSLLSAHAASCGPCRAQLHSWELLNIGLDGWDPPGASGSIDNIVAMALQAAAEEPADATVQPKPAPNAFDLSAIAAPILLSAAVLAIALFVPMFLAGGGNDHIAEDTPTANNVAPEIQPASQVVVDEPAVDTNQLNEAELVRSRELFNEMRSRLNEPPTFENLPMPENLPSGLQPIAGSFEVALNTFRKTLPGRKGSSEIPGKPQASKLALPSFA